VDRNRRNKYNLTTRSLFEICDQEGMLQALAVNRNMKETLDILKELNATRENKLKVGCIYIGGTSPNEPGL
jgi:hypothetical protein